jgi:adenylate cyclase
VLFSDIRGFSIVAEHLAPREVAAVVGRHATAMAEVVLAHGGMLDKFAGDGVMAVFGAPKPMPGDEDRAIACAVAMQRRQRELNVEAPSTGHAPTEIGIGVNTGLVIAGTLGGAGRLDYTVIGDAVNVAQRLQSEAGPGEILVSAATVGRGSWPSAEAAGVRELKGRKEPVDVFRIAWEDATSLR